jgi:hypothetical protein
MKRMASEQLPSAPPYAEVLIDKIGMLGDKIDAGRCGATESLEARTGTQR